MAVVMYLLMIFVWGFSWIAIKWQHGEVATEVSIFYRFAIASLLMFAIGFAFNKLQAVKLRQHPWFALQGVCLFCLNFIAFYTATHYIASGLTAVIMATAPIFNAIHGRIFYGTPTSRNFWLGVCVGLGGISLLFGADLLATQWSQNLVWGLLFSLLGTWFFSIGNMISMRNSRDNVSPFTSTAYAMCYGSAALLLIIWFKDLSFSLPLTTSYLGSLFYLAVIASVIGFTAYLILVERIGANAAAYLLVITPVVALSVSSVFEDYQWTWYSSVGLLLVALGNMLTRRQKPLAWFKSSATPVVKA